MTPALTLLAHARRLVAGGLEGEFDLRAETGRVALYRHATGWEAELFLLHTSTLAAAFGDSPRHALAALADKLGGEP